MIRNQIIFLSIILLILLQAGEGIKFGYVLEQRQNQCFHESAQKGTRYQIDIKGNSSFFSLQVTQNQPVYTDSRTEQFYKYFSAFANSDQGIIFCITSLADATIQLQVEFYHGFYLQNSQQLKGANEFLDMSRRIQEISNMVNMNYDKYKRLVIERQPFNNRIQIYATFAIILFLAIMGIVKVIYLNKTVKFMKVRKII